MANKPRRQFELPEVDRKYLDGGGLFWETVCEGKTRWVLIHGYPTGSGYNYSKTVVALEISGSYPDSQIDMVYFSPHLVRNDEKSIPQLSMCSFDDTVWQRWSRHRTNANPWRREHDCIETHLLLVDEWLERELRRAA